MGPTRTTFPDMNNGEVVQEVGDRRDKGKGRDTGYVKSTERLGQSMPSVPRQGDWTAVSRGVDKQTCDSAHDLAGWCRYERHERQEQRDGSRDVGRKALAADLSNSRASRGKQGM